MFGIGTQELLVILFTVLILFGSKRIPEVARSLGSGLATFRRIVRDAQREIDAEILNPPPRQSQTPKAKEADTRPLPTTTAETKVSPGTEVGASPPDAEPTDRAERSGG